MKIRNENCRVPRTEYLQKLIDSMHTTSIKIISGVRRCGKSYLLTTIFREYLLSNGVDENHILVYDLDDMDNERFRERHAIYDDIKSRMKDDEWYYIMIDEVQLIDGFHDVLNDLLHRKNADVYVTGSNSRLLSSDIVTEFRGRGHEIRLRPFSFSEMKDFIEIDDEMDVLGKLEQYMMYGSMPELLQKKTDADKNNYLRHLIDSVYLNDVIERNGIRSDADLENIMSVLCSCIGSTVSIKKITDTLRTRNGSGITNKTVKSYVDALCDSFLFECAERFDVRGRKYIGSGCKYYITDVGMKNAHENFRQADRTHIMENIVYNELRSRGFDVDVGSVDVWDGSRMKKTEIDFVANRGQDRYYIQCAYSLDDSDKRERETRPFGKINDAFAKVIITYGYGKPMRDSDGIMTIGLYNFLTDADSLK